MKLKVGIFFDGTGCNANNKVAGLKYNITNFYLNDREETFKNNNITNQIEELLFKEQVKLNCNIPNSYHVAYDTGEPTNQSNIWHLYQIYQKGTTTEGYQIGIYVNGCGTEDDKSNDLFTMATGWSFPFSGVNCGVIDKTNLAINLLEKELDKMINTDKFKFETIEFELFGYSRGSASARHFANRISKEDKKLIRLFEQFFSIENYRNIEIKPCGKIAFIGLFDTVAAILALSDFDLDINSSNTGEVNVELGENIADEIFQITAGHEIKYNLSLNRILPNYIAELELPGCHVDIGGGHPAQVKEGLFISKPFSSVEFNLDNEHMSTAYKNAEREYALLINHPKWGEIFKNSEVEILSWRKEILFNIYLYGSAVFLHREKVNNGLEKVSLQAMLQYATIKGCKFGLLEHLEIPDKLLIFNQNVISAVNTLAQNKKTTSVLNKLPTDVAKEFVHCEFFWSSGNDDRPLAVQGIDITTPSWLNVLLINRPTDNLIRSSYDSYGK